ncbi:MAG: rhamnogalacturonan acetylesterase [Verrucomicrobiota bacterium]
MFRNLLPFALSVILLAIPAPLVVLAAENSAAPTLYLIGDSTMADKPRMDLPERGWGQLFAEFIVAPATLDNRALNGRSTLSFIQEKHWAAVLRSLQPGDWVIIQFGHNDQKADKPKQYAAADGTYRDHLRRFIAETRKKQTHPILATSVVRRKWENGTFIDTLGEYPAAARAVAAEENVPLLELHDLTFKMESSAGVEGSKKFHFPGDDTHFSETGAREVAALAAAEIHRLKLPLMKWVATQPVSKQNPPADR